MYTIDAARVSFEEEQKGSLTIGKRGDVVILQEDPLQVEQQQIKDISIVMTIKDGTVVYRRNTVL